MVKNQWCFNKCVKKLNSMSSQIGELSLYHGSIAIDQLKGFGSFARLPRISILTFVQNIGHKAQLVRTGLPSELCWVQIVAVRIFNDYNPICSHTPDWLAAR